MRLVSVYDEPGAVEVLYRLISERPPESFISHTEMPSLKQHRFFVESRPFLYWYLILKDEQYLGAIECKDTNEFGVAIFKEFQRKGYGTEAVRLFMNTHTPQPEIRAIRNGHWLANIATHNDSSKAFFRRLGFSPIQETWQRYD